LWGEIRVIDRANSQRCRRVCEAIDEEHRDVALAMESKITDDFRVSLTNAPGKESYPIVSFTWFLRARASAGLAAEHAVNEYLSWVYASGQQIAQAQGSPCCRRRFCKRCARSAALH